MRARILTLAGAALLLGGCAPRLYFVQGPGGCGVMQRSASHRTSVMATTSRIQALQARHSLAYRYEVRSSNAHWRTAATGECR